MTKSNSELVKQESVESLAQLFSQRGLSYVSKCAVFATFFLKEGAKNAENALRTYQILKDLAFQINEIVHSMEVNSQKNLFNSTDFRQKKTSRKSATGHTHAVIMGVDLSLWQILGQSLPDNSSQPEIKNEINNILNQSPPYKNTGGDLYFHIKSDSIEGCREVLSHIEAWIRPISEVDGKKVTEGNFLREGRVYGRRILHGLIQVVDPINLSARVLIGDEDIFHKGGCFCLTQKFVHNWAQIQEMSQTEIEDMIGRDTAGNINPQLDKRSHMRCVRAKDESGLNHSIFTQGQPFGNSSSDHSREEGVYVSAFARSITAFNAVLSGMLGPDYYSTGEILDKHFRYSHSVEGSIWYVPSCKELGMQPRRFLHPVEVNHFFQERSKNGLMYYNSKDFLHSIWKDRRRDEYPISDRIIELLEKAFVRWQNTWYEPPVFPVLPELRDYLKDTCHLSDQRINEIMGGSIAERKGYAINATLNLFSDEDYCRENKLDLFRIDPNELIAGILPPFTLGTGVAAMPYLDEAERMNGFFLGLDESSMAGHIVPGYDAILKKGIKGLLQETEVLLQGACDANERDMIEFYNSVILSLKGVQKYFQNYADLAGKMAGNLSGKNGGALAPGQAADRDNLQQISSRMSRLKDDPPESFLDALQMIFSLHCCLHLIGELVSIGRLDQLLEPYSPKDAAGIAAAQEAVDCFWIKMSEKVLLNRHYYEEKRSYGTCALPYTGGPVPIGDKLSQWVMQVTVGGYKNVDDPNPADGCNEVTRMALRSARRLPLNSPCLSLRLNRMTPDDIFTESVRAILSGGASPFFYNDDLLVKGIMNCDRAVMNNDPALMESASAIRLQDARNYCADGCWETMLPGQTEMALSYVLVTNAVEMALNQGATYINAGPGNIRGSQASFLSSSVSDIKRFEDFLDIFFKHFKWQMSNFFNGIFSRYGNIWKFCPSPLLSTMVEGCLKSGKDLTNGGARYHVLMPMIFGIPCAIDSLWAIKQMVFENESAVTSLPELVECLFCDWGYDMIEPFQSVLGDPERSELKARRYKDLRKVSLQLPKFGSGNRDVDEFGGKIAARLKSITFDILSHPEKEVSREMKAMLDGIVHRYSLQGRPFLFHLMPAYGTFEDYIGLGLQNGASADGRRKGTSLSSNFSPMPSPMDLPPDNKDRDIFRTLMGWNGPEFKDVLDIVAPVDIDIPENLPSQALTDVLLCFREGKLGSNMLSISCADRETLLKAQEYPERYDLLRLRYGGWSEFFIGMYKDHQEQHLRRPVFSSIQKSGCNGWDAERAE